MNMRPLLATTLALAAALPVLAQATKPPAPAKPAPAKPAPVKPTVDQNKIDKAKQELRNIKEFKDAEARLKKGLKNIEAAKKEDSRLNKKGLPSTEDAEAKLERLKKSTSEDDIQELENLLKDNKPALEEELRKLKERARERMKKEVPAAPAPNPAPAPDPAPRGFDNAPAPTPLPMQKGPEFRLPLLTSDHAIKGPSHDPKNPDRLLPASDPRTRTYVLTGNVRLREPTLALDADEVDALFKQGEAPGSDGVKPKATPPSADPVNRQKSQEPPFERIIARGRVRVMFVDKTGHVQVARGGYMLYDGKTGVFTIKDWPEVEFGTKLFRGPSKSSVVRLSDFQDGNPAAQFDGFEAIDLERESTTDDMPKTPGKPVPAAGPTRADSSATAPAPSPKPR